MERRRSLYHPLTVWPALALTQAFAVAWNIGILVTLLGHVATTDLAFGWQSTLNASAERVHRITQVVAAPWSGLIKHAHPTLEQVRASRFIYSEGVKTLDLGAAVSWWPFLTCAVAFYGLLLRGLFLLFCAWKTRRTLASLPFDHHECNALLRRLTGPLVQDAGEAVALTIPSSDDAHESVVEPGSACLCLYAREMEGEWPVADFGPYLERAYGWRVAASLPTAIDRATGHEQIESALTSERDGHLAAVALFVSARRSPIVAIALFLKHLQSIAGPRMEFIVILVARDADGQCTSASEETHRHWRNFSAIHQLPIGIETWQPAFAATPVSPPNQ